MNDMTPIERQIEGARAFVQELAPGLHLQTRKVGMLDSVELRLGVTVSNTRIVTNQELELSDGRALVDHVPNMLVEVQMQASKDLGLEAFALAKQEALLRKVIELVNTSESDVSLENALADMLTALEAQRPTDF